MLYRTTKMLMGAVFTVVSVSIVATELLRAGMALGGALGSPSHSDPCCSSSACMLTEPLTLPPRRWQQLALAAVVGVVFAVPYNLGFVANYTELALLVGNLIAFLAGQRGGIRLSFREARPLTPTTTEFSFRPERPIRFAPGQYMELHLPHAKSDGKGRRRVFSLTSAPDARELTFGVGTAEPVSAAKRALLALQPGDPVTATAVGGDFVLPRRSSGPVLLIAAGMGTARTWPSSRPARPRAATSSCSTWPSRLPNSLTRMPSKSPAHGSLPGSPTAPRRRRSWRTQARFPGRPNGSTARRSRNLFRTLPRAKCSFPARPPASAP